MTNREYFRAMFDLFESDGFKLFMEEVGRDEGAFATSLRNTDGNDLCRAQGALYYIDVIKNKESSVKFAYDQVQEEGELDAPLPV